MRPLLHIFMPLREMEKFNLAKSVRLIPTRSLMGRNTSQEENNYLYECISYIYTAFTLENLL